MEGRNNITLQDTVTKVEYKNGNTPMDDGCDPYDKDARHSKYWRGMQTMKPIRFPKRKVPGPVDNVGLLSFASSSWLNSVMYQKEPLEFKDLPILSKYEGSDWNSERFKRILEDDKNAHDGKSSMLRVFLKFLKTRAIVCLIVIHIHVTISMIGPGFLVNRLLLFAENPQQGIGYGIGLAFALGITELFKVVVFAIFWGLQYRAAIRVRSGCMAVLFDKVARLRTLKGKSVGELMNLLGNDAERLIEAVAFTGFIMSTPYQVVITAIICWILIGWTSIIGIIFILLFVPLQFLLGKLMARYRGQSVLITDKRVRMMSEILNCIKLIKMYAWESSFAKVVDKLRSEETKILAKARFVQSFLSAIVPVVPTAAAVVTFLVHTLLKYPLEAPQAFSVVAVFNAMRVIVALSPRAVRAAAEVAIAFRRMDELMEMEEMQPYYVSPKQDDLALHFDHVTSAWDTGNVVENNNLITSDDENQSLQKDDNKTVEVLFDINLIVPKGRLLGICGSVGSGKSSLISTILGQLRIEKGSLALEGSIAYVPQQAWIFHDSARENILFGKKYDERKYNKVVEVCSLVPDFEILPDNDLTEIGERGINLSGGQKQRISLARAVYSDRDIILLDDPLSAVDAHVGKHIFYECIKKSLADKTVIFVTHQLQYLKDCDEVVLLKDGRISEHGHHDELMKMDQDYAQLIKNYNLEQEKRHDSTDVVDEELLKEVFKNQPAIEGQDTVSDKEQVDLEEVARRYECAHLLETNSTDVKLNDANTETCPIIEPPAKEATERADDNINSDDEQLLRKKPIVLVKTESQNTGTVKSETYHAYVKAGGGYFVAFGTMMTFVLVAAGTAGSSWWLTIWLNTGGNITSCKDNTSYDLNTTTVALPTANTTCNVVVNPDISTGTHVGFYQGYYFLTFVLTILSAVAMSAVFARTTLAASSGLHNQVFRSVLSTTMSFFDTTPAGRILNRFSRDLDDVDNRLPMLLGNFTFQALSVLTGFISIAVVFPYFLLPCVFLAVIFGVIFINFRRTIRQLKRLDSTARSPWFSHLSSTVQGLSTIHAYDKTNDVIQTFNHLVDAHCVPHYAYFCSNRWLALRLDGIVVLIITLTASFTVFATIYPEYLGTTTAAFSGLALSYAITMTGLFQIMVRFSLETESFFTSVERIHEYVLECPNEEEGKVFQPLSDQWPKSGDLTFSNVRMRYRKELPFVLKDVTFKVNSKEKIGIVGRTGAGKSSLGTVLFRLVNLDSGQIVLDGVDVESIRKTDLRRNISIIPQDPVLFVGTIRYNLDPFQQYSDEDLWKALERTHMKDTISGLIGKLEADVVENGENFSVGERQLLCMARAILRHSRIIMLDEATAAIDTETDSLVQDTIREAFSDCTMLTIAHRLNTVLTCDKILVMDDGKVSEFDHTATLLGNPNSQFSKMVAAATSGKHKTSSVCGMD